MTTVNHVVFFKALESATEEQLTELFENASSLNDIECVLSVEIGKNLTQRTVHDFGLMVRLQGGEESIAAYASDPIHVAYNAQLRALIDPSQTLCMDFTDVLNQ
eukprot:TRINITY_DN12687_c0_g1_i1.p1 TRINITY_DN12687_c0_g1~~TRINITY_DN12687_c0_g1_i1.p1  ORF type:complete len:104 (-),score=31.54 TRINITY_DN12687_c0_g1_i1:40-351(-)